MTWKGKVTGGVVVLDDPKGLPDGTVVRVERMEAKAVAKLRATLLRHAGKGRKLPSDLAENHDHYIRQMR